MKVFYKNVGDTQATMITDRDWERPGDFMFFSDVPTSYNVRYYVIEWDEEAQPSLAPRSLAERDAVKVEHWLPRKLRDLESEFNDRCDAVSESVAERYSRDIKRDTMIFLMFRLLRQEVKGTITDNHKLVLDKLELLSDRFSKLEVAYEQAEDWLKDTGRTSNQIKNFNAAGSPKWPTWGA